MKIIPAIDILNSKCVRLSKGDYASQKIYNHNPLEVAKEFETHGMQYLHLVDLDGAKSKHMVNYKILEAIAKHTALKVDVGGGIKSTADVERAFDSGASQVTVGSIAVDNPALFIEWLQKYGPDKIMLGADAHYRKIATHGWTQVADMDIVAFIHYFEQKGIQYVVCTDIEKDGMMSGPALHLYKELMTKTTIQLIASGGVSSIQDVYDLKAIACHGAIIGKAIYEGAISLQELSKLC
jgi:phosphoribosylformimino-5-aminoimidazole carboxamide ribotide isomerase